MPRIEAADPTAPAPRALLAASAALMEELFDAEENHYLAPEELAADGIHFFVARDETDAVTGTIAMAEKDGYGEVKALFVDPDARGQGLAQTLLAHVEGVARERGLDWLRLETGDRLLAAIKLYRAAGFTTCGPFGDYEANSSSVFMEKFLG